MKRKLSDSIRESIPIPVLLHPLGMESTRQQAVIYKEKAQIVCLAVSEDDANMFVELVLTLARQTIAPNESAFKAVMDDIRQKLARGDSVTDVRDWIRSNIRSEFSDRE